MSADKKQWDSLRQDLRFARKAMTEDKRKKLIAAFKKCGLPEQALLKDKRKKLSAKHHKQLLDSLKAAPGPDSPLAASEAMLERKQELERIAKEQQQTVIADDDRARIAVIEETVEGLVRRVSTMKEDLALLPRILEMVEKAAADGEG